MSTEPARKHPTSPCAKCPFQKDAPREHWAYEEYERTLEADRSQLGGLFGCHSHAALPPQRQGFCAGWALDQKRRGVPSIRLRMAMIADPSVEDALRAVTDGGHALFPSIEAMCRANGVNPKTGRRFKNREVK